MVKVSGRPSMLVRVAYVAGSVALGGAVMGIVNARQNDAAGSVTTNAPGDRFPPPSFSLSPPRTIPVFTVPRRTIPPPRTTVAFTLPRVNRTPLPTFPPPPPIVTLAPVDASSDDCNPHYSDCVPNDPDDVDCWGNGGNGPSYQYTEVSLLDGADPYGLDGDNDGFGCDGL